MTLDMHTDRPVTCIQIRICVASPIGEFDMQSHMLTVDTADDK